MRFWTEDGANVAYYMQNFDKGKFSFSQIDFVVTAMEKNDLNPLGKMSPLLPITGLREEFSYCSAIP